MTIRTCVTSIVAAVIALLITAPIAVDAQRTPSRRPPATPANSLRRITLSRLGYPDGVSLEGSTAAASVSFPLPQGARVLRGTIALSLEVAAAGPGSNLQLFVNGTRRLVIPRGADASSPMRVSVSLAANDLQRETVDVQLRSYLAIGRDRCIDERLGSAFATILPQSNLEYEFDPASVRSPQAVWSLLLDTVQVGLPHRALTAEEFGLAYDLALELRADARVERFVRAPAIGALSLDSITAIRALVAWRRLVSHRGRVLPEHPTLAQMGIDDLTRLYGYRATWRLPVDLRMLPRDRVPSALDLEVASAPSTFARGVQYFVSMNGTLLRAFVGTDDGRSQLLHVDLPQYLLATYNEVRVEVQRHRDPTDYCQEAEALYPAQILGSSVLRTTRATKVPQLFTGTALRLPDRFPLYLSRAALGSGEEYLSATVSLARGMWGNRAPRFEFYDRDDAVQPTEGFVVVGSERALAIDGPVRAESGRLMLRGTAIGVVDVGVRGADAVVIQVARVNGQSGVVVALPRSVIPLPDSPERYGNADVIVQSPGTTTLRVNTQNLPAEVLYGDFGWLRRWAWTPQLVVGIAVSVLLLLALMYVVWQRNARARRRMRAAE